MNSMLDLSIVFCMFTRPGSFSEANKFATHAPVPSTSKPTCYSSGSYFAPQNFWDANLKNHRLGIVPTKHSKPCAAPTLTIFVVSGGYIHCFLFILQVLTRINEVLNHDLAIVLTSAFPAEIATMRLLKDVDDFALAT